MRVLTIVLIGLVATLGSPSSGAAFPVTWFGDVLISIGAPRCGQCFAGNSASNESPLHLAASDFETLSDGSMFAVGAIDGAVNTVDGVSSRGTNFAYAESTTLNGNITTENLFGLLFTADTPLAVDLILTAHRDATVSAGADAVLAGLRSDDFLSGPTFGLFLPQSVKEGDFRSEFHVVLPPGSWIFTALAEATANPAQRRRRSREDNERHDTSPGSIRQVGSRFSERSRRDVLRREVPLVGGWGVRDRARGGPPYPEPWGYRRPAVAA